MTIDIPDSSGKLSCILITVIHPGHKAIFKCDPSACHIKIVAACFQNFIHTVFSGNRHKLLSFLIIWRMKRKCKCHLQLFLSQFVDFGYQSAGRYCQISLADMKSSILCENVYKPQKIVIIIQWLTGSHHYYIGHSLTGQGLNTINLVQHF